MKKFEVYMREEGATAAHGPACLTANGTKTGLVMAGGGRGGVGVAVHPRAKG